MPSKVELTEGTSNTREGLDADNDSQGALARGLDVLSSFGSAERNLGNAEISRRCGLPKSTVSRLTSQLTKLGYLHRLDDTGKYRLGAKSLAIGGLRFADADIRRLARPYLQQLADGANATASLAINDRLSMIFVEVCRTSSAVSLILEVGARIQVVTSAIGRAWLVALSETDREDFCSRARELDQIAWPATKARIDAAIKEYQTSGVASSFGEWQSDVNAIACPLRCGDRAPIMSISCGGPASRLSPDYLMTVARPRLLDIVERIERTLQ